MELLVALLVGLIAGYLADLMVKDDLGLLGDLGIGLLGSVVGSLLLPALNINLGVNGILGSILVAFIGALTLLLLAKGLFRVAHN